MTVALGVIAFEILMMLAFLQWKINIRTHFSLKRKVLIVDVKAIGITFLKIKVMINEQINVFINGKNMKYTHGGISQASVKKLVKYVSVNKLVVNMSLLALLGGDAKNCAIACALLKILPFGKIVAHQDVSGDRLDMDFCLGAKISAVDIVSLSIIYILAKGERNDAKF